MVRTSVWVAAALLVGAAAAAWLLRPPGGSAAVTRLDGSAGIAQRPSVEDSTLAERLRAVEDALAREVALRQHLQARLDALDEALTEVSPALETPPVPSADQARRSAGAENLRSREDDRRSEVDRRVEQLLSGGFSLSRARWIAEREAALRMAALEQRYEAARQGEPFSRAGAALGDPLRAELGDAEYERYLEATGRPTRVAVRRVLTSSPAEAAGLQPGDEIVAYAGERVFSMRDVNRLTLEGRPGETVAIDVLRDGQPMQLYVARGPLGIFGPARGFGAR